MSTITAHLTAERTGYGTGATVRMRNIEVGLRYELAPAAVRC